MVTVLTQIVLNYDTRNAVLGSELTQYTNRLRSDICSNITGLTFVSHEMNK